MKVCGLVYLNSCTMPSSSMGFSWSNMAKEWCAIVAPAIAIAAALVSTTHNRRLMKLPPGKIPCEQRQALRAHFRSTSAQKELQRLWSGYSDLHSCQARMCASAQAG